ncbi:hypothetical protein A3Q56_06293 [Intoshia linei]|uniref:Uncharacterized protein n=1 Tax=Intoshia linei TaxID=1819745 RepID=A0A177AX49_9BILA|nr:hypothetical protein A3Q56_06293 [Intoshia linei]
MSNSVNQEEIKICSDLSNFSNGYKIEKDGIVIFMELCENEFKPQTYSIKNANKKNEKVTQVYRRASSIQTIDYNGMIRRERRSSTVKNMKQFYDGLGMHRKSNSVSIEKTSFDFTCNTSEKSDEENSIYNTRIENQWKPNQNIPECLLQLSKIDEDTVSNE